MKNLIKKILKEEGDFDWVKPNKGLNLPQSMEPLHLILSRDAKYMILIPHSLSMGPEVIVLNGNFNGTKRELSWPADKPDIVKYLMNFESPRKGMDYAYKALDYYKKGGNPQLNLLLDRYKIDINNFDVFEYGFGLMPL